MNKIKCHMGCDLEVTVKVEERYGRVWHNVSARCPHQTFSCSTLMDKGTKLTDFDEVGHLKTNQSSKKRRVRTGKVAVKP